MKPILLILSLLLGSAFVHAGAIDSLNLSDLKPGKNKVSFVSKGVEIVGDLYVPEGFDTDKTYNTIVMTPPFPQVKDQTLGNYGPKFAEKGYVALAFDYSSKGESGSYQEGFRNDDDMPRKWEDLRNGISFLKSQPFVDRLFGTAICGGANIMSSTIITDLRVEAFASVSGMLATDTISFSDKEAFKQRVKAANDARQEMFESGEGIVRDYFGYDDPSNYADTAGMPLGVIEGFDYYGTPRGGTATHPNFSNAILANVDESAILNLGEHYADKMIQPFVGIVGSEAETAPFTKTYYDKVTSEKEYHVVEGASHVSLYDNPEHVDQAVNIITDFFSKH